jgi:hypothetical protein
MTKITSKRVRSEIKAAGSVPAFWGRNAGNDALRRITWAEQSRARVRAGRHVGLVALASYAASR